MRGRYAARLADFDLQRMVAHELAQLIALAFHDPGKIPPFEARGDRRTEAEIEAAEERRREIEEAKVRAWFIGMSKARH